MLIPLGTDRPLHRPTLMTYVLVGLCCVVFVVQTVVQARMDGAVGASWFDRALWLDPRSPTVWGFVTSIFLHGGFGHLLFNMLFLWVFGPNVEDRFGRWGFLAFYLCAGVGAGLAHMAVEQAPVIGASGAIAGVTGAYMVLFPRTRVKCLLWFFIIGIFWIPAWWIIALAIARDFVVTGLGISGNVATLAHLGGYGFGIVLSLILLWRRVVVREPYDLFTLMRQSTRRRTFQEVGRARDREMSRRVGADGRGKRDERREAISGARAAVSGAISQNDGERAVSAYAALVEKYREDAAAVIVRSGSVDATDSLIGMATAEVVNLHDSNAVVMAAERVEAKSGVQAFILLAQRVEGPVTAVLTPLTALAVGAGIAFGLVAFRGIFSRVFRRPLRRGHA